MRLTAEEREFRDTFLKWLERAVSPEFYRLDVPLGSWEDRVQSYKTFQRKLFDARYAGITYPKEYGGAGGTFMQNVIVSEALGPWLTRSGNVNVIGHGMAGPTILAWGTEAQKRQFLPRLLDGTHVWCQGFSERGAGSDLGSVATRAVRSSEGGSYVINGHKIWTTMGHVADYCLVLARTNPERPKHAGLSYFLVDMRLPGITVRPIVQTTGEAEFNEVFFDDVLVGPEALLGQEGQGWQVVLTTLMFERVIGDISMASGFWWEYQRIAEMAQTVKRAGRPASEDPLIRQKLVQCFVELLTLRHVGYRSAMKMANGGTPGPEGSIAKLFWSQLYQRMTELALEIQGPYGQCETGEKRVIDGGWWQQRYLFSKAYTLAGGTSEIQKNIIAERVLRLPKESKRSADSAAAG